MNANTVKITRQSAGSYNIMVDGICRGEISKVSDGWVANFCNEAGEYGAAIWGATKREIVAACKRSDWN
jgi:hypothetical protein